MPRPYGKPKKRKRELDYGRETDLSGKEDASLDMRDEGTQNELAKPAEDNDDVDYLPGIPIAPLDEKNKPGVIFILEKASLEVGKVGKTYQLLNSDEHSNFLRKHGKNPADYRPDIVHQALLTILDSPLNKAERVRAVYVRTEKGVLIEVKPYVRIPRTMKRFAGIMCKCQLSDQLSLKMLVPMQPNDHELEASFDLLFFQCRFMFSNFTLFWQSFIVQLLQKMSISAVGKREKLMRVIKNPVTQYLPPNSRKIGFSYSSEKLVDMQDYVTTLQDDHSIVFVVGAMAHGKIEEEFVEDYIAKGKISRGKHDRT
ncbi:Ribosomal RNA small subunit methyltransferase NEP1-like protein [Drosera capensis]